MSATLSPASSASCRATCFCTLASSASVVGHTSGQCVKPKNTSVGWPRSAAGDDRRAVRVDEAEIGERPRLRQQRARLAATATAGWPSMRATYTPATAAATAMAPTDNPVTIRHGAIIPQSAHEAGDAADVHRGARRAAPAARARVLRPRHRQRARRSRGAGVPRHGAAARRAAARLRGACQRRAARARRGAARARASRARAARRISRTKPGSPACRSTSTSACWCRARRFAELIERRFAPWIDARARAATSLDIGTGSGCIALACAKAFPRARVDAVDIDARRARGGGHQSPPPASNTPRAAHRVRPFRGAFAASRYDIIVSNPPYVGEREMRGLPREYRHEPRRALAVRARWSRLGRDHPASGAARHLRPRGLLVVEVGNTERVAAARVSEACRSPGSISSAAAAECSC